MHTAQQNHAPHEEPRNESAPQSAAPSVPQTISSKARVSRAWRCFLGTLVLLGVFIVHGCGGGGGGGLTSGGEDTSSTISIQVRDRNTGALLPSTAATATTTPVPGLTPNATTPPTALTVRLVGRKSYSVSFNDAQTGAVFNSVPRGTYQVFVDNVRSSPDIVVASNTTGNGAQNFTVIPGLSNSSQFISRATIQGSTRLSVQPIPTGTATTPAATPTQSSACPNSDVATGAYLVRVVNFNTKRVVAVYSKPNLAQTYSLTSIPLDVANGSAVSTTFYLQIFTDPSDTSISTSYSGQSALFTIRPNDTSTFTLPDVCATQGTLIRTPTSNGTATAATSQPTTSGNATSPPNPNQTPVGA